MAHRKKLEREKDKLVKQQVELQTFDEKLRHYADQRISLDLDDGVKVNYGKFGDLLAEVKAITGKRKTVTTNHTNSTNKKIEPIPDNLENDLQSDLEKERMNYGLHV